MIEQGKSMKKLAAIIGLAVILAAVIASLSAQPSSQAIVPVGSSPIGNSCSSGTPLLYYSGVYCGCDQTGHYAAFSTSAVPTFITNEVVSGGTTTWTLAHTPVVGTVQLFSGSAAIWPGGGADYTISGATITTNSPVTAGTLHASYRY